MLFVIKSWMLFVIKSWMLFVVEWESVVDVGSRVGG